jgi:hypothetical protein
MDEAFTCEGGNGFLALSSSGRRLDRGSFSFKRGGDGDGNVLGLLRHIRCYDAGIIDGERQRLGH